MAERTSTRRRADPRSADTEELIEVNLRRSVRPSGAARFYGPGLDKVPRSLYESLKLSPDLVETDGAGNPLAHTVAASVFGGGTSTPSVRNAHPTVHRDEAGDMIEDSDDGPVSEVARRSAAIAENAEKGPDRQGGQLAGESGSLDDTERAPQALPGQHEQTREQADAAAADAERARSTGNTSGTTDGGGGGKPLTKTQLRQLDDKVLADLARRNRVAVPKTGGKKALVDKLHGARVTLD